jgi:acyl-CoA reductase-like NAD-dependent aldehyde dehydrogenase
MAGIEYARDPSSSIKSITVPLPAPPSPHAMAVELLTTISPITNQPIVTRHGLSESEAAQLLAVATKAFNDFRLISLEQRQTIVKKALQLLAARKDVLAKELTEQMGRPIAYTAKEVSTAVARAEYLLKISDDALKDTEGEQEKGFTRFIRKAPVGPVLIIFAWNVGAYPAPRSIAQDLLSHSSIPISYWSTP